MNQMRRIASSVGLAALALALAACASAPAPNPAPQSKTAENARVAVELYEVAHRTYTTVLESVGRDQVDGRLTAEQVQRIVIAAKPVARALRATKKALDAYLASGARAEWIDLLVVANDEAAPLLNELRELWQSLRAAEVK